MSVKCNVSRGALFIGFRQLRNFVNSKLPNNISAKAFDFTTQTQKSCRKFSFDIKRAKYSAIEKESRINYGIFTDRNSPQSYDAVIPLSDAEFSISREIRTRHCRDAGLRSIREARISRNTMQLKISNDYVRSALRRVRSPMICWPINPILTHSLQQSRYYYFTLLGRR